MHVLRKMVTSMLKTNKGFLEAWYKTKGFYGFYSQGTISFIKN